MPQTPLGMITGLVLAGGEARRMGGADKGLQPWAGRALAAHVIERLQPQVGELIISANRHAADYAALGARVVADQHTGFAGPLAGIAAGLAVCTTRWLVVVPCDGPRLPLDLVDRLMTARGDAAAAAARAGGRTHPTFAVLDAHDAHLRDTLDRALRAGHGRLQAWLEGLPVAWCDFDDAAAFQNFNTPEDLLQPAPVLTGRPGSR